MCVDELHIYAKDGKGGDGVVRWLRERNRAKGGPAGGNGGNGGDVYVRAVRDLNLLSKYTGAKEFRTLDGESGRGKSQYGKGSNDLYIDVPIGSVVTDEKRNRVYELFKEGQVKKILLGGQGGSGRIGLGKSSGTRPGSRAVAHFTAEEPRSAGGADTLLVGLPVVVFRNDLRHGDHLVAVGQADQPYSLRRPPDLAYGGQIRSEHDSTGGNEHQLVVGADSLDGDDVPVAIGGLDVDDALSPAADLAVFLDARSLTVAVFTNGE